ncbi:MAG: PAS domain-containing protein, partial [Planctomycetota bacterium]
MENLQQLPESQFCSAILSDDRRLQQINDLDLVDSPSEESFDRITRLATDFLDVPVSLVSIVTDSRQFFKSATGLPEPWATCRETPLDHSFCKHVVDGNEPLIVENATKHEFVSKNLAVPNLGVIAYLGFPLSSNDGQPLGSFCVIDTKPRNWSQHEIETVRNLALLANNEICLRDEILKLRSAESLLSRQSHEIENTHGFLRDILDSVDANICIVDETGQIIDTNACWRNFEFENEGNHAHTSIGANYLKICEETTGDCADGASKVAEALREIIRGEREHFLAEYPCHSPDEKRWYQVRLTPLKSAQHRGAVIAHIDITDRILATRALEKATFEAEKLALVARYTDNAVVITDHQCRIEWVNEGFTHITGYELDEVLGKVPGDFLQGPETSPEAVDEMRTALREKRGFDVEIVNYSKAGEPYWLAIEVRPITDSDGVVTHFIAVESDITQKKKAAEERERLQNELLDVSRKAGMAELATGVLHNVGNVLNSINVSANLVSETLSSSAISSVRNASDFLNSHSNDHGVFLTEHKKGKLFPAYIDKLASRLKEEQNQ